MKMSIEDSLFEELEIRCKQNNVDYEPTSKKLRKILRGEEPIAYLFGAGFAPENPNIIIDLLVLTHELVIGYSIEKTSIVISRGKRSMYNMVMVSEFQDKIKVQLLTGSLGGGFYVNNLLKYEDKVWEFVESLNRLNFP